MVMMALPVRQAQPVQWVLLVPLASLVQWEQAVLQELPAQRVPLVLRGALDR